MTTSLSDFNRESGFALIDAIRQVNRDTRKVSAAEQDFLRKGLVAWTQEKTRQDAEAILVEYWQASIADDEEGPARTEPQIRAAFHEASKDIHEITGGAGVIVDDNKLVLAKTRKTKQTPFQKASKLVLKDLKKITPEQDAMLAEILLRAYAEIKKG
tara:strand:+ start:865 stop:1335 length:471 start_codon:yes stop_codon:yes gene_type:complete